MEVLTDAMNITSGVIPSVTEWDTTTLWPTTSVYASNANNTVTSGSNSSSGTSGSGLLEAQILVPLYSLIFVFSVVGNCLVIVTLFQNRRMRTVTNIFLLNLAVADLLLGVFCMPFTLLGQMLRDFIFGAFMCKMISYFQAVSVSVGVWTLVAISLERYFAICRPLRSRHWQTRSHAYKTIFAVWLLGLTCSLPIAILTYLKPIRDTGRHKCREEWPGPVSERSYNIFLVLMLLILPLVIMALAYWLIAARLWRGLQREGSRNNNAPPHVCPATMPALPPVLASTSSASGSPTAGPTKLEATNGTPFNGSHHHAGGSEHPLCSGLQYPSSSAVRTLTGSRDTHVRNNDKQLTHSKQVSSPWSSKSAANVQQGPIRVSAPSSASVAQRLWFNNGFHRQNSGYVSCPQLPQPISALPAVQSTVSRGDSSNFAASSSRQNSVRSSQRYSSPVQIMDHQTAARKGLVRSTYTDKSILAKKKVMRMLFVIVLEFFLCWTPIYVVNTWHAFNPSSLYQQLGPIHISLIQLMAYLSSCCNPITYCFMNEKFRSGFMNVFGCRRWRAAIQRSTDGASGSLNDSITLGTHGRSFRSRKRERQVVLLLHETNV